MKNVLYELTKEAIPVFKNQGMKILYKKGQLFVRPEDSAQGIYYLVSGQAMIHSTKPDGSEQIIGFWENGSIFGKVGTILPQRFTHVSIQALSECVVYRLDLEQFQRLLKTEPTMAEAYMRQVSFNNIFILNQVLVLGEKNIRQRIIAELLLLSDYYGDADGKEVTLRIELSQEQLANMLSVTREYFSKSLKTIKEKGLVTIDKSGAILIPDITRLQQEIMSD